MTDHPNATDWRNRAEAAEQRCAEVNAGRDALRSHADALAEALERGLDWFRHATADDDCDWLNEHGWPLAETRAKEARTALANYTAWLIDGGAK